MRGQSFKVFKRMVLAQVAGDPHPGVTEIQGKEQAFWQFRPFTRVLTWGRNFRVCCAYVIQNKLEAMGFVPYRARKTAKPLMVESQKRANDRPMIKSD